MNCIMNLFPVDHVVAEIAKSLETESCTVLSVELVLMIVSALAIVIFLRMIYHCCFVA